MPSRCISLQLRQVNTGTFITLQRLTRHGSRRRTQVEFRGAAGAPAAGNSRLQAQRQIARDLGLSYSSARMTVGRYKKDGAQGIQMGRRGRPQGSGRTLTAEQEERIWRLITDKRPEHLKLDFALWMRKAATEHMTVLEKNPDRIKAFFKDPIVAYVA